jgi:glutamine synthetase
MVDGLLKIAAAIAAQCFRKSVGLRKTVGQSSHIHTYGLDQRLVTLRLPHVGQRGVRAMKRKSKPTKASASM